MKFTATLTLGLACFLVASHVSAAKEKFYKWTDAKGQTHYSQHPPGNTPVEVLKSETGHSDPVNYATAPGSKDEKKEVGKEEIKSTPKDKERCELARKNAETLNTYARIRVKQDDGEYRFITPEEHKQKLEEANHAIGESCE